MPINAERATREISAIARMRTEEYFCNQYIAEIHQEPERERVSHHDTIEWTYFLIGIGTTGTLMFSSFCCPG